MCLLAHLVNRLYSVNPKAPLERFRAQSPLGPGNYGLRGLNAPKILEYIVLCNPTAPLERGTQTHTLGQPMAQPQSKL